jgi:riboflavin kinase / FMN adenylyltransferase
VSDPPALPPALPDLSLRALRRLPLQSLPDAKRLAEAGTVVTFGVFDGVHRGHREMLQRVKERAAQLGATPVAVVMRPRPVETLGLAPARPYLTSLEATIGLIRETGIDAVSVLRFNRGLALANPHDFLRKLQARTRMRELWLGSRARIGRGPEGSIASAKALGEQAGFEVVSCDEVEIWDDHGQGEHGSDRLSKLNHALGRNYELPGYAGPPLQMLGDEFAEFPLAVPKLLYLPPRGEYAVRVRPSQFGGADIHGALPGTGAVIVHASSGPRPVATLIGPHRSNWGDTFMNIEFAAARPPEARQLLDWAHASVTAHAPAGAG